MKKSRSFLYNALKASFVFLLCAMLWGSSFAVQCQAQSGRRLPDKPKSSPSPNPPEESGAKSVDKTDDQPKTPLAVVRYLPNISSSSIYTNVVLEGCLQRFSESSAVKAMTGQDMNRKQASDYAKASQDTYVVWIQLEVDALDTDRASMGYVDPRYLYVSYMLLSPKDGKVKTTGHVYQGNRRGGVIAPVPGSAAGAEYYLRDAGRETADRILAALGLAAPAVRH